MRRTKIYPFSRSTWGFIWRAPDRSISQSWDHRTEYGCSHRYFLHEQKRHYGSNEGLPGRWAINTSFSFLRTGLGSICMLHGRRPNLPTWNRVALRVCTERSMLSVCNADRPIDCVDRPVGPRRGRCGFLYGISCQEPAQTDNWYPLFHQKKRLRPWRYLNQHSTNPQLIPVAPESVSAEILRRLSIAGIPGNGNSGLQVLLGPVI